MASFAHYLGLFLSSIRIINISSRKLIVLSINYKNWLINYISILILPEKFLLIISNIKSSINIKTKTHKNKFLFIGFEFDLNFFFAL